MTWCPYEALCLNLSKLLVLGPVALEQGTYIIHIGKFIIRTLTVRLASAASGSSSSRIIQGCIAYPRA